MDKGIEFHPPPAPPIEGGALQRLLGLIRYNRDWPRYLYHRYTTSENKDRPLSFRLRNGQVVTLKWDARFTLNETYLDHVYNVPGVNLADCRSILDIGANVGLFALFAASVAPRASVYCFEPEPNTFAMLLQNLKANQGHRIFPHQLAVSGKCGRGRMELGNTSVTHSLNTAPGGLDTVEVVDMSRVFELAGVDRVDFVKMDVEGAELDILTGTSDEQLRSMSAISMEWHYSAEELNPVAGRLRALGFEVTAPFARGRPQYLKARLR